MNESLFYYLNNLAGRSQVFDWLAVFCAEYLACVLIAVFLVILIFSKKTSREKIKIFVFAAFSVFFVASGRYGNYQIFLFSFPAVRRQYRQSTDIARVNRFFSIGPRGILFFFGGGNFFVCE
jgi:hypothetical protein